MVRAILEKMKPAELRKYISAHNKVVRKYIGVEIKQARAAYSQTLKVRRREMKAAQTIDAKGKKKEELIELIMKEPTLVRQIKVDKEQAAAPAPVSAERRKQIDDRLARQKKKRDEERKKKKAESEAGPAPAPVKKVSVERLNRIRQKIRDLGKQEVAKKIKLADEIEKVARDLKIKKARAGKKPAVKPKPPPSEAARIPKMLAIIAEGAKKGVRVKGLETQLRELENEYDLSEFLGAGPAEKPKPKAKPAPPKEELKNLNKIVKDNKIKKYTTEKYRGGSYLIKSGVENDFLNILVDENGKIISKSESKQAKPKAKPKAPTAEDIKKAALEAAEEETDDDDETPDPPIKAVPKRLHSVWKNYMEERVGEYYTASDQKDEIDDLKFTEKEYLKNEKIRADTSVSASKQASARNANARTRESMSDEFKTDSDVKKIYKEFAPRLLKKFEEFEKDLKKRKEADRKAEAAAAKEEIKFQEELAKKKQKEDEAEEKRIAKFEESERKRKEAAKKTASKEIKSGGAAAASPKPKKKPAPKSENLSKAELAKAAKRLQPQEKPKFKRIKNIIGSKIVKSKGNEFLEIKYEVDFFGDKEILTQRLKLGLDKEDFDSSN